MKRKKLKLLASGLSYAILCGAMVTVAGGVGSQMTGTLGQAIDYITLAGGGSEGGGGSEEPSVVFADATLSDADGDGRADEVPLLDYLGREWQSWTNPDGTVSYAQRVDEQGDILLADDGTSYAYSDKDFAQWELDTYFTDAGNNTPCQLGGGFICGGAIDPGGVNYGYQ